MHLSNEVDYGLRAMIILASNPEELIPSKEISARFRIPYNFLTLILPKLVKAQLVESVQGPKGGYRLKKPANKISFLEVITAIDGPIEFLNCNSDEGCDLQNFCSMVNVWNKLRDSMTNELSKVTLDQVTVKRNIIEEIKQITL
ncbi:MAG: Rrf2 family transcriptional regulator [Deltaproteobacteria bacterium]|nr:Rrf2 family transcriptional regulator [Deltaproteobacteria bacterium]